MALSVAIWSIHRLWKVRFAYHIYTFLAPTHQLVGFHILRYLELVPKSRFFVAFYWGILGASGSFIYWGIWNMIWRRGYISRGTWGGYGICDIGKTWVHIHRRCRTAPRRMSRLTADAPKLYMCGNCTVSAISPLTEIGVTYFAYVGVCAERATDDGSIQFDASNGEGVKHRTPEATGFYFATR